MRAPFQILAIPYKIIDGLPLYCVFHRADFDQWQFIAGGGEDDEMPLQAAIRAEDTYVVPEYSFGFNCKESIKISHEHTEYIWLTYEEARLKLKWDSNRTALYELHCRLRKQEQ